jgi:protein-S-isoprenylcysteine O-methyltransferase Ste14
VTSVHWLLALHGLFYAVFVPRAVERWWPAVAGAVDSPRPAAGGPAATPRFPLAFHALAMALLYYGIGEHLGRQGQAHGAGSAFLLAPQPAAGLAVLLAAAALAAWTLVVFRSWRLAARIDSDHQLCTGGPFRWVRNPIYLAMDLLAAGTWLWLPTTTLALALALVALGGDLRGRSEERALSAAFGDPYDRYRRRVRRFLPGIY